MSAIAQRPADATITGRERNEREKARMVDLLAAGKSGPAALTIAALETRKILRLPKFHVAMGDDSWKDFWSGQNGFVYHPHLAPLPCNRSRDALIAATKRPTKPLLTVRQVDRLNEIAATKKGKRFEDPLQTLADTLAANAAKGGHKGA